MTTAALNTKISEVENEIPDASSLVITNVSNTKISKVESKIPNISKYITTNKLTAESSEARLREADLVNKADFDTKTNKL